MNSKKTPDPLIFLSLALALLLLLGACSPVEHAYVQDYIYGYDTGPAINHVKLTNDNTYDYCFLKENEQQYTPIINNAFLQKEQVLIEYETYTGSLHCGTQERWGQKASRLIINITTTGQPDTN